MRSFFIETAWLIFIFSAVYDAYIGQLAEEERPMDLWQNVKRSAMEEDKGQDQIVEAVQEKQGREAKELFKLEESNDEEVDLAQELAFIKGELAAAKLELTTGKEDRMKWWRMLL